ncbi:MAG TPA: hypothetical protein VHZ26_02145 [Caulobacteraceae bacterium]|jgi:hypothetical protein|nr:hypothetical protein [Caulobacteraceae bacterium]
MSEIAKVPVSCCLPAEVVIDPLKTLVVARQGSSVVVGTPPVRAGHLQSPAATAWDRSSSLAGSPSDYLLLLSVALMA